MGTIAARLRRSDFGITSVVSDTAIPEDRRAVAMRRHLTPLFQHGNEYEVNGEVGMCEFIVDCGRRTAITESPRGPSYEGYQTLGRQ